MHFAFKYSSVYNLGTFQHGTGDLTSTMASRNPTQGFRFNHTGLRVADLDRSITFYSGIFGMKELGRMDTDLVTLVFLGYYDNATPDAGMLAREGVLELVFNKKSANATHSGGPSCKLAFSVPDVSAAARYLKTNNVKMLKDAGMPGVPEAVASFLGCKQSDLKNDDQFWTGVPAVAFVEDPDGHIIEIVPNNLWEA